MDGRFMNSEGATVLHTNRWGQCPVSSASFRTSVRLSVSQHQFLGCRRYLWAECAGVVRYPRPRPVVVCIRSVI